MFDFSGEILALLIFQKLPVCVRKLRGIIGDQSVSDKWPMVGDTDVTRHPETETTGAKQNNHQPANNIPEQEKIVPLICNKRSRIVEENITVSQSQ